MSEASFAFDHATSVHSATPGRWQADLHPAWTIGGRPHGGYLMAVVARAADHARIEAGSPHPHPVAISAQFLRSPALGPAEVRTEVVRVGRSVTQMRAVLHQGDHDVVQALLTFGQLDPGAVPVQFDDPMPIVPTFDELVVMPEPSSAAGALTVGIAEVVAMGFDPATTPGSASTDAVERGPDREAAILGRIAFRDGRPFDPISLLFVVDASPPTTFLLGLPGWVPTLELTAYVRAEPVAGPLVFRQRSRLVQGGLIDELCDVWDGTGRLVAQASQLAAVRT